MVRARCATTWAVSDELGDTARGVGCRSPGPVSAVRAAAWCGTAADAAGGAAGGDRAGLESGLVPGRSASDPLPNLPYRPRPPLGHGVPTARAGAGLRL